MTLVADTFGWDTVFAVRVAKLNDEIVRRGTSPKTFSQAIDADRSVSGTFGPWQVASGTGDIVTIGAPLSTCAVTRSGATTNVDGQVTVMVGVRLQFVPPDVTPGTAPPTPAPGTPLPPGKNDLVLATPTTVAKTPEWEESVGFSYVDRSKVPFLTRLDLEAGLKAWMGANLSAFEHVFATVDIDRTAAVGAFQWLQPHDGGYAYASDPAGDVFGLLATTGDRVGTDLAPQLSSGLLAEGQDAALLISPARLLDEVVKQVLMYAYPGTTPDDFSLTADGTALTLVHPVKLQHRTTTDGTYGYDPYIDTVDVSVQGTNLIIDATSHTSIFPGIESLGRHRVAYVATLVNDAKGQRIAFGIDPTIETITKHWTYTAEGYSIEEKVVLAAAAVAFIIVSILTDGVPLLLLSIGIALAEGILLVAPKIIALQGEDDAPAIDLMVADATGSVVWSDTADFSLSAAAIGGGLLLGGSLTAKTT